MQIVRRLALAAIAAAAPIAASCSGGESESEMQVRVRSEVYVENFGGDVDALIGLCSVDIDDPAELDTLVTAVTPDVLDALQFACPVVGERVTDQLQ